MKKILTVSQMRKSDRNTIQTGKFEDSAFSLMQRAAFAVLDKSKEYYALSKRDRIAIISGKGGNGGDGICLAMKLSAEGYDVVLYVIDNCFSEPALSFYNIYGSDECSVIKMFNNDTDLTGYTVVFDCIFGTGFKAVPSGMYNDAINAINKAKDTGCFIISVDINSGLNGDNGLFVNAVRSNLTVSVSSPQPGHYINMAKDVIGIFDSVDIGLIEEKPFLFLMEKEDVKKVLSVRRHFSSKADYGYIALVAGCLNYSGAAKLSNMALNTALDIVCEDAFQSGKRLLDSDFYVKNSNENQLNECSLKEKPGVIKSKGENSDTDYCDSAEIIELNQERKNEISLRNLACMAEAAERSGSGVVQLSVPLCIAHAVSPYLLESTLFPLSDNRFFLVFKEEEFKVLCSKFRTIAFGMGLGNSEETQKALKYILENYKGTLILDADGLNALSVIGCNSLSESCSKIVLTPHITEFSRLSGLSKEDILTNPIEKAKEFAKKYNVILLLKGPSTIVTDGTVCYLVNRGCAGMATAGSGDVLSGVITAVLGYSKEDIALSVAAGAYIAGFSGELAQQKNGQISMLARDTVAEISTAIRLLLK